MGAGTGLRAAAVVSVVVVEATSFSFLSTGLLASLGSALASGLASLSRGLLASPGSSLGLSLSLGEARLRLLRV